MPSTLRLKKPLFMLYPHLRKGVQAIQQSVLGYAPPSSCRTGIQWNKKTLDAVYIGQYYTENESIDIRARKVMPGWLNEKEERRALKLKKLQRDGRGPPKKGSGKKKKK